jgi:hypothetical protein
VGIGYAFGAKIGCGASGGCEIQVRDTADEMAIHFFRKWAEFVARAEAGFDVTDADFFLKGYKRGGESSRGVALNEEPIGTNFAKNGGKSFENAGCKFERCLIFLHEIQIMIGRDGKDTKHLIEHVPMLGGYANVSFHVCGASGANDRRHFDGFGTCAENGEDAHELGVRGRSEKSVRDAI